MPKNKFLIVVGGPTASGKTALAIELAQWLQAPILSSDSRQFYREMSIGTAKPDAAEQAAAPHYFIDSLSISEPYSVGQFEQEALLLLERLYREHDHVILSGGSGLYIKAVCEGLDDFPSVPASVQQKVQQCYEQWGLTALQEWLHRVDPDYYVEVDLQNPHRLIRAIAVSEASQQPFSSFRKSQSSPRIFTSIYLQLHWPRQQLYERIDQRVEQMLSRGLRSEAAGLYDHRQLKSLQTVGYQEYFAHFDGKISEDKAVELIKRNSRRYAKRQLTWMRRDGFWKQVQPERPDLTRDYLEWVMQHQLKLSSNKTEEGTQLRWLQGPQIRLQGELLSAGKEWLLREVIAEHPPERWWLFHEMHFRTQQRGFYLGADEPIPAGFSSKEVSVPSTLSAFTAASNLNQVALK